MKNLDETDLHILKLLQSDGRITNAELAKRVGLSPPSALQRVRQLEQSGYIRDYVALLDAGRVGLKVTVIAGISLALHQDQAIERFCRAVAAIPEVLEVYHVSGEFDYLLKILVKDIPAYEALVREKLSQIKGVQQIRSSFVLGTPKQNTQIPL